MITGSMRLGETGDQQFSTDDEGTVRGAELSLRGRWSDLALRGSYALQKATGIASGLDSDSIVDVDRGLVEYPLAFDRRHSIDFAVMYGRAAGAFEAGWSVALTGSVQSGYPLNRYAAAGDTLVRGSAYLPWTSSIDLRVTRELGRVPGCGRCVWRVTADGRNLLGRENVLAYRSDTGSLTPSLAAVRRLADAATPPESAIPVESPAYARAVDLDGDGLITAGEFRTARFAAALERHDPTLFIGEARQLRLGIEVTF